MRASDDTREQGGFRRYLRLRPHCEPGRAFPIPLQPPTMSEGETRVLGRAPTCDFAIPDSTVSSRHAELTRTADGWLIRDLGSRNGTRLNGWLVKEDGLQPGDVLALGSTEFVFRPRAT
jgi:pSer/pThr/pTyr-binding forkhead associated (FHA) protein